MRSFVLHVRTMRQAQVTYFRDRRLADLESAKRLEHKVDEMLNLIEHRLTNPTFNL